MHLRTSPLCIFLNEPISDIKHSRAWLLFIATGFSAVLVLGEVCLFANDQLTPILFLAFQTGKLAYAVLVFILFLVFSTMSEMEYLRHFVLDIVVFWYVFHCLQFDMSALVR